MKRLFLMLAVLLAMVLNGPGLAYGYAEAAGSEADVLPGVWHLTDDDSGMLTLLGPGGAYLTVLSGGGWVSGEWYVRDGRLWDASGGHTLSMRIQMDGADRFFAYEESGNQITSVERVKDPGPDAAALLGAWKEASGQILVFNPDGTALQELPGDGGDARPKGFFAVKWGRLWMVSGQDILPADYVLSGDTLTLTPLNHPDQVLSFTRLAGYAADTDVRLQGTWGEMEAAGGPPSYFELTFTADGRCLRYATNGTYNEEFANDGYYKTKDGVLYVGVSRDTALTQPMDGIAYAVSGDTLRIWETGVEEPHLLSRKSGRLMERAAAKALGGGSLPVGTFFGLAGDDVWDLIINADGAFTLLVLNDEGKNDGGAWRLTDDGLLVMAGQRGFLQNWRYSPSAGEILKDASGQGWTLRRQTGPLTREP